VKPIRLLVNADEVIRLLAAEGDLTPAEISDRLDIPRPSVYRLLDGLHAVGLTQPVRDSAGGTAALSMEWLHLADRARDGFREWGAAQQVLGDLVDRTHQTAYLSVRRGNQAVCIAWEPGRAVGVLVLRPGRTLPLHAGAAGRSLLAFDGVLDEYLKTVSASQLHRFTARTLTDAAELRDDVERTRRRGYTVSDGDVTDGIAALGVPIRVREGREINPHAEGALSLAGVRKEIISRETEISELLSEAAKKLSQ
jgi:IclR family acetate operon transcriptional repressor